jgi:hypothetical protein
MPRFDTAGKDLLAPGWRGKNGNFTQPQENRYTR